MNTKNKTDKTAQGKPELPQYDIKHIDFRNLLTVVMGTISNQTGEPFDKAMMRSQCADEIWRRHKHAEALAEALREIAQSILDTSKDGLDRSTSQLRKAREALANWEGAK